MKFFDHAYITVESGKGGNGCTSARREAGVPYGGPNGGNGGHGGHVYINVDPQLNTLTNYKYQRNYKAPDGERGQSRDKYGKNGQHLTLFVPLGTVVKDRTTGHVLFVADQVLETPHLLLKGGDGGAGNMHFKNSILQYPDFCLNGEPGQYLELELELQLLADVGLIGTPSVGKSSIINLVSNAKAQVAEYHFTTITPNLGSVRYDGVDWNVIDIPGLIEGASDGKGLGIEFLRHILKCSIFNFVLDFGRWDEGIQEFGILWAEIINYCRVRFAAEYDVSVDDIVISIAVEQQTLVLTIGYGQTIITRKVLLWTINKSDESEDQDIRQEYVSQLISHIQQTFTSHHINGIDTSLIAHNILRTSTYLHEGIDQLIMQWKRLVEQYNHVGDIARHTQNTIDPNRSHSVTLIEVKDISEIDGYLEAKPYLSEDYEDEIMEEGEEYDDETQRNDENENDDDEYEQYDDANADEIMEEGEEYDDETQRDDEDENDDEHEDEYSDHTPSQQVSVRSVYEPDIARIVYMVQWGNDQAEQWFWKYMQKSGGITWLRSHKVKHGDILTFEHPYYGVEERQIIFEA